MLFASLSPNPFFSIFSIFFFKDLQNVSCLTKFLLAVILASLISSTECQPAKTHPNTVQVHHHHHQVPSNELTLLSGYQESNGPDQVEVEPMREMLLAAELRALKGPEDEFQEANDIEHKIAHLKKAIEQIDQMENGRYTMNQPYKKRSLSDFEKFQLLYGVQPVDQQLKPAYPRVHEGIRFERRGKDLRLSLTNNIDVLREKLYMEIARRNRLRSQSQIVNANNGLASIG